MSYELHISIPENSPVGQIVQRMISAEQMTPEQALTSILTEAVKQRGKKTPAQELIGAFSSPEDVVMIDEGMEAVRRLRAIDAQRRFDV